jgi:hypothetical protein
MSQLTFKTTRHILQSYTNDGLSGLRGEAWDRDSSSMTLSAPAVPMPAVSSPLSSPPPTFKSVFNLHLSLNMPELNSQN